MSPHTLAARRYVVLFAVVLILGACSSSGEDESQNTSTATATQAVTPDASEPDASEPDAGEPTSTDQEDETVAETGCPQAGIIDLWPGLEAAGVGDIAQTVRVRTNALTQPNPETCTTMKPVDPLLDTVASGAAAVASVENTDPYIRYDIFVYESAEVVTQANARDLIRDRMGELVADGMTIQVSKVGQTIFVARSFEDDNGGPSAAASVLLDYYSAQIAGTE